MIVGGDQPSLRYIKYMKGPSRFRFVAIMDNAMAFQMSCQDTDLQQNNLTDSGIIVIRVDYSDLRYFLFL